MLNNFIMFMAACCVSLTGNAADLSQALAGAWTGSLQYRDFSTDRQVVLPTTVTFSGRSSALQGAYVYDDGPGKTVKSTERWSLAPDDATLTIDEGAPARVTTYRAGAADLTLEAEGTGVENKQTVAVRTTITQTGDALTITRLTHLPGQPWLVRHVYRLARAK